MKKLISVLILGLVFISCKKDEFITPMTSTNPNPSTITVRIRLESLGSNTPSKIDGIINLVNENTNDTLYHKLYLGNNIPQYIHDTTLAINSINITAYAGIFTSEQSSGNWELDYNADTKLTIWVDGNIKYLSMGGLITNQLVINLQ